MDWNLKTLLCFTYRSYICCIFFALHYSPRSHHRVTSAKGPIPDQSLPPWSVPGLSRGTKTINTLPRVVQVLVLYCCIYTVICVVFCVVHAWPWESTASSSVFIAPSLATGARTPLGLRRCPTKTFAHSPITITIVSVFVGLHPTCLHKLHCRPIWSRRRRHCTKAHPELCFLLCIWRLLAALYYVSHAALNVRPMVHHQLRIHILGYLWHLCV